MHIISDEKLAKIMEDLDKIRQKSTNSSGTSSSKDTDYEVGDAYSAKDAIRPLVVTNCSEYVVAHARNELRPARQFAEVSMLPHILDTMRKLGLNRLLRLQSYTWPHLAGGAGHGAMIVGAPGSGRTFSYVPSVCHAVCKAIRESRSRPKDLEPGSWQQEQYGAKALILVPDLRRVRQVSALCHALLRKTYNEEWFTLTLNVPSTKSSEFFLRLLNGVGCLVATPAQLVWFWQEAPGLMRFPCLQFLVYDDVDLMSKEQLMNAQQVLQEILPITHSPQVVMVSQTYSPELMAKLSAVNHQPALVFGDIMEAALYGGTRIRISLVPSSAKVNAVIQMLQQRPPNDYRTVIYCVDDRDMQRLVVALKDQRYNCLPYYQNSDMEVREQVHSWQANSRGVILLCTDNCPELIIRDAHTLIHHGMSISWSKFKMRHLMLSGNLSNSLAAEVGPVKVSLHSLVLMDDSNHRELPRLVDFLQLHQEVDPGVVALAKRIRQEMDKARSEQKTLCSQILVLGKCYDSVCENRHHVTHSDRRPDYIPASGDVKVKLVQVYSPTHFCVRLLEHMPPQGTWKTLPYPAVQEMRMQLMLNNESPRYWPPVVGVICLYNTTFTKERVRVLKVAPIQNVNIVQSNLSVEVQALDADTRIFVTDCGRLFECPEAMQREPPMACDLRLLGLVPYSGERSWTEEDCRNVKGMLTQLPKDHFLQAKIQFATAGTLFVRNLVAIVYAGQFKVHLRHLNLAQKLIKSTLAKRCEEATNMILDFFEEVLIQEKEVEEEKEVQESKENAERETQEVVKNELEKNKGTILSGRCLRLAQVALEVGRDNQLQPKLQETRSTIRDASSNQVENYSGKTEEDAKPHSNEDQVSQLYECLMNCARLQLEDKKEPVKESGQVHSDPTEVLNQVVIPIQLPDNVVRPSVTYYQTTSTLELHVCLLEDDYEYQTMLLGSQLFFRATSKSSELIQQFILTLRFPIDKLRHHIRGRTVYISITKSLAYIVPLEFGEYSFLKPNHDGFGKMYDSRKSALKQLVRDLRDFGYSKPEAELQNKSDESEDEDRNLDGIERVDYNEIFD
ncbi:putative ATP-dependent RNA helicase BoYb [Drosophila rhopaloa]|uniref:RNA helicase n=1 Tax=Drosophila rhopaloa TaxID=1041015 RepID=A0A6P4FHP0_DRORH|nr:putative ATP-dependent RNA helicase BoYb [Drosophila rhopaloa]